MRGEVILLSRNIQIEGDTTDNWGCTIVTTEMLADPSTNEWIIGHTIMDNVEVKKCSQKDTEQAAIRFEGAVSGESKITRSVVHDSLAWSMFI